MQMNERLVLGTVQLGLPYGVNNSTGKPEQAEAVRIVETAWNGGVRFFDTAQAYGESEAVLGSAFAALGLSGRAKVISKLSPDLSDRDAAYIDAMARQSLESLGLRSLYCLMLHREEHLPLLGGGVGEAVEDMRQKGRFRFLGISVYTPEAALAALDAPQIDIVQLPASIFDRRFESAGVFEKALQQGKTLHVRSALLQGVLCMAPEALPEYLRSLKSSLKAFRELCARYGQEPASLAIHWLLQRYPECCVLFGAESPGQVARNISGLSGAVGLSSLIWKELEAVMPPQTPRLLNPALWGN